MSIFSSLKPQGGQRLSAFDLSRRDIFSAKSGVLNVNFVQHTIPESKYEVNHAQITRVDAVQTAPFARMSENYEYYFVPYSQIFHDFERLYYGRGDNQRNPFNDDYGSPTQISNFVPCFNYYEVVLMLCREFIRSRLILHCDEQDSVRSLALRSMFNQQSFSSVLHFDVHGEIAIDEMLKLFDNLGYGNVYSVFNSLISPLLSFSTPSFDSTKVDASEAEFVGAQYNMNLTISLFENFGISYSDDLIISAFDDGEPSNISLDSFVVGSVPEFYIGLVQKLFEYFAIAEFPDGSTVAPVWFSDVVDVTESYINTVTNHLIADYNLLQCFFDSIYERYPSVLNLAAYVKVFADIYRNTQFDLSNYESLFNFDYIVDDGDSVIDSRKFLNMLVPRFRQYKKDIFTGFYPNAQFGSVAVSSLNNPSIIQASGQHSSTSVFVDTLTGDLKHYTTGQQTSNQWNLVSGVSALAIRQALSLQRYKERIL